MNDLNSYKLLWYFDRNQTRFPKKVHAQYNIRENTVVVLKIVLVISKYFRDSFRKARSRILFKVRRYLVFAVMNLSFFTVSTKRSRYLHVLYNLQKSRNTTSPNSHVSSSVLSKKSISWNCIIVCIIKLKPDLVSNWQPIWKLFFRCRYLKNMIL